MSTDETGNRETGDQVTGDEVTGDQVTGNATDVTPSPAPKRSRKSKIAEFFAWFLVSVIVAIVLVLMSESLLPANF